MAHDTPVDRLVQLLDLEREDDDGFVAATGSGKRRLFGGLVAAQAARALVHGAIYRRDGTRVASVCQEGLIRYEEGDPIR